GARGEFAHESSVAQLKMSGAIHEMLNRLMQFPAKPWRKRLACAPDNSKRYVFVANRRGHRRGRLMLGRTLVEVVSACSAAGVATRISRAFPTSSEKHEIIGHDLGHVSLLASLLIVPGTSLELALDINLTALFQVLPRDFG